MISHAHINPVHDSSFSKNCNLDNFLGVGESNLNCNDKYHQGLNIVWYLCCWKLTMNSQKTLKRIITKFTICLIILKWHVFLVHLLHICDFSIPPSRYYISIYIHVLISFFFMFVCGCWFETKQEMLVISMYIHKQWTIYIWKASNMRL